MTYPARKGNQYQCRVMEFQDLGKGVDDESKGSKQPDSKANEDHDKLLLRRISCHRLLSSLAISILVQTLILSLPWPSYVLGELPDHGNRRGHDESRSCICSKLEKIPHCKSRQWHDDQGEEFEGLTIWMSK
jgi:hypothetical protein